jgi:methyl-accepting chemotaxis protein
MSAPSNPKRKSQKNDSEPIDNSKLANLNLLAQEPVELLNKRVEQLQLLEKELRSKIKELAITNEVMAKKATDLNGLNEALNNAAIVSEVDLQGNIIFVNEAFCSTSQYSQEELIGKKQSIVRHPDMPASLYEELWATITKGNVWRGEIKNRAKDGSYYWVDVTITPVIGDNGKPIKYIGVRFIITQQKEQAENIQLALQEAQEQKDSLTLNEEKLRQNMEEMARKEMELAGQNAALNNAAIVSEVDLQGNILFVNDEFCRLAKYTREELIGKKQSIVRHPDMPASVFQDLWGTITRGKVWKGQVKNRSKDASHYWVEATITPVMGTHGKPIKYIGVRFDITAQKEQEEAINKALKEAQQQQEQISANEEELRQNLEEMAATQEEMARKEMELTGQNAALNNAAIVSEVDLQGNILFVNDEFCRLAKYTREELIGKKQSIVRHPDMPASVFQDLWGTITRGKVWKGQVKNRSKDASHYWVEATITPVMGIHGKPIKYIGVRFDITAQKEQEEAINQALAEAQQQQEEIAANEEELRQNMEEMTTTQEEMARKEIEMNGQFAAIDSTSAYIEFNMDGTVRIANALFLSATKYTLDEIKGQHHQIFVDKKEAFSPTYSTFWNNLRAGIPQVGEFKRIAKDGSEIWLTANYTPVLDLAGKPVKVIKLATDTTVQKLRNADFEGQLEAIGKSNAVIEFNLDGSVIKANDIFLHLLGYQFDEIKGQHHQIFCEREYVNSLDYKIFWEKLNRGEFVSNTFKRIGKNGREIFIQASYNPILDVNGKPFKVVKFATDITEATVQRKINEQAFLQVVHFINEMAAGNFNAHMQLDGLALDKNLSKVTTDLNLLRDTLKDVINGVNNVVKAAGQEGNLRARFNINTATGDWKELGDSLNSLLINVSEPILEINRLITALSMGDLTNRFAMQANGDIKDMANALNIAMGNLNKLMRHIESNSLTVASSSSQMLEKAESMKSTTSEVSSSISQMAEGAQEQASRIDESSKLVEGILKSANETGSKAEVINGAAERGQRTCQDGLKIIRKVVNNMSEITNSADITSNSIEVLTNRSEEISRTLRVITDIASQTNLLALNAAIEAARAGDAGRGFAVVAEEIRKLAEDSRKSAVDIEKVIKDVQKDTNSATKAIDKMKDSVVSGTTATKEAEEAFESINSSSNETLTLSKQVLDATKEQKDAISVVVKNIEKIVVVSEETATGTHEIASSSQELSKSMNEVSDTGKNLSAVAKQLKDSIAQFKLS